MVEAFVYKIGRTLGGRKEVLDAPMIELLEYMNMELKSEEMEAEKERAKERVNYLIAVFSQPSSGKESADYKKGKKELLEMLFPKPKEIRGPAKVYEWDDNLMKRITERQNAEIAARKSIE